MIFDAIVVGAGISGLSLALELKNRNRTVLVLEKSKSVGGRIATRRDGEARYDHGAQFYRAKKNENSYLDNQLGAAAVAEIWFSKDHWNYKVASEGLTKIPKYLSSDLSIQFNEKVLLIKEVNPFGLEITCESGQQFQSKQVFLASPLPQSLALLNDSNLTYPENLKRIKYAKAIVGLFEVESTDKKLLDFAYEQEINQDIFSISNQQSKKVSLCPAFTAVMTPAWSQHHFEEDDLKCLSHIESTFINFFNNKFKTINIKKSQIKKWRYSHPETIYEKPFEVLGNLKNIYLLGDAFGGASVSGAAKSAESLVYYLFN